MWREEVGMMEMLLSYIGDFNDFDCWSNWRPILVDILSTHEDIRRLRNEASHKSDRRNARIASERSRMKGSMTEDSASMYVQKSNHVPSNSFEFGSYMDWSEKQHCSMENEFETAASSQWPEESNVEDERDFHPVHEPPVYDSHFDDGNTRDAEQEHIQPLHDSVCQLTLKKEVSYSPDLSRNQIEPLNTSQRDTREWQMCDPRDEVFQHACQLCEKKFRRNFQLKVHMRSHTGERPFKCLVCGKSFSQSCNLNKHMLIHTGERPHSCHICGKSFTQNICLLRHLKTHSRETS